MSAFTFHPDAHEEFLAAARYYEQRRLGLGAIFSFEVEATIAQIVEAPARWPEIKPNVRRRLTYTFPYAVLYSIEPNSILIVAVMHCSREPGYWNERLGSA